jgi:hypothetical protein
LRVPSWSRTTTESSERLVPLTRPIAGPDDHPYTFTTHLCVVMMTVGSRTVGHGLVWIGLALYSSSIFRSAACWRERHALVVRVALAEHRVRPPFGGVLDAPEPG